jgi:hypothetical protein
MNKVAQFTSLEAYNEVNTAIAAYKDIQTNGEYNRTHTLYEYNPEPESVDGFYYMEARPELVEAGLFEGVALFDSIPVIVPDDSWLKADIQAWLTDKGISFTLSMTKAQLLELI